jgi:hypothetical protein
MRLLLLNQYGPASGAPTGRILSELGLGLQRLGHEIVFLDADSSYGQARRGMTRIIHELRVHGFLLARGLVCKPVDAVLSLTSPACLAVTAGAIAKMHRARHFHWAMDLYPEVGVCLGEIGEGALSRLLTRLMLHAYEHVERLVALDEDMRDFLQRSYGVDAAVIEPFAPEVEWTPPEPSPGKPTRWLYSGNLGRAHEIDVLLQVQKKLEERGVDAELVLQGQGAQFAPSQEAAQALELQRVQWRPPAAPEMLGKSLLEADALVVTRKAGLKGLLLPSKLMLAELSGRPILWIGDTDGFTALRLKKAGHGVFAAEEIEPMADWLEQALANESAAVTAPRATGAFRKHCITTWNALLHERVRP